MRPLLAFVLLAAATAALAQTPRYPFPHGVNYAAGSIRPSHRTQAQLDQDVRDAYVRWKAAHLRSDGTDDSGRAVRTAQEFALLDRAGRMQLPADFVAALDLRERVRLSLEPDHVRVAPGQEIASSGDAMEEG